MTITILLSITTIWLIYLHLKLRSEITRLENELYLETKSTTFHKGVADKLYEEIQNYKLQMEQVLPTNTSKTNGEILRPSQSRKSKKICKK